MAYSPGEANSTVVVKQLRDLLPKPGMTLARDAAGGTGQVGQGSD
jgi:putative ABC transport system substrate-binding protein